MPHGFHRSFVGLFAGLLLCSGARAQDRIASAPPTDAAVRQAAAHQREILAHPEQFGTSCCQILQIPAAAFTVIDPVVDGTMSQADYAGYMKINPGTVQAAVWAPLTLPTGVVIKYLDLYFYDADPSNDICVRLDGEYGSDGGSFGLLNLASTCSSGSAGLGYAPHEITLTVDNNVLLNGYQYFLVMKEDVPSSNLAFRAADVWWERQVSPPPGTPTFNDVPVNHPFFQFVEALAASGITSGCGNNNFCPDAPLTRGQMAVFLAKALGLYWRY